MAKPKMMQMMKQVKQVKKMQKALASKTVEARSKDDIVVVVAKGDMTVKTITIDSAALDPARKERLEKLIASTVNSALDASKKAAAGDMAKMGDLSGLADMFRITIAIPSQPAIRPRPFRRFQRTRYSTASQA